MGLEVTEQELLDEARDMALHLRLLEKHTAALPGRVRAEVAEQAEQAAGEYADDGDPAGALSLRWFASHLRNGGR